MNITHSMKTTKPESGMERDATPEEIEEYSKFVVHQPTLFSLITAPLRRRQAKRKWFMAGGPSRAVAQPWVAVAESRATGWTVRPDRQQGDQVYIAQTEEESDPAPAGQ